MYQKFTSSPYIEFSKNLYLDTLIDNWQLIRDQFFDMCIAEKRILPEMGWQQHAKSKPNETYFGKKNGLYSGDMSAISLMIKSSQLSTAEKETINWQADEHVRWWENRRQTMPFLWNYAKKYEADIGAITFNTAFPGAVLNPHFGLSVVKYIRIHLCLTEDPDCIFNIEGWTRTWKNGEIFGFDDGRVMHGTVHRGENPRTILMIDILRDSIKPYALTWPCRDNNPTKQDWEVFLQEYTVLKKHD